MKSLRNQIMLGIGLIVLSAALYTLQIALFHAKRDTFFYLFQDLAFVPIQVLLVTLIVDQVLKIREKAALLKKLNMVIGVFFSEAGTGLLRLFSKCDRGSAALRKSLMLGTEWTDRQFANAVREASLHQFDLEFSGRELDELKTFLSGKRDFLLTLLENQNLLEHETFTDLLWSVFHLAEELQARDSLNGLSRPDAEHIAGDITRAYGVLIGEWLSYMKHLKKEYPYLYSLAARLNPFDPSASAAVK